ncbi:MAG TPA: cobalt-factor II C(20)-methyltransferase [Methanolinea sp.]|jgi:precorrin-2/cobalt-factor-2 C20-methyltransferase|nr:cobalt-factor II C(20)-methyltransferase [Methanolinea sp.]HOS81128.1 cobalt-factor II C(20)-methyltransferase [Methanolinea sp.]HPC54808.1 cobalt-factor II C(20)-methyltransferase [Methanolinea sp.]HQE84921.1 cobalt-factor II C(20)-methyltransferase [Methanolinea sp.]HQI13875.1 cobalt-factor II C(20)-methyltransferase [Methanolinea sp.]
MLIGLGLGPGDPELLTLRAVRLLREADAVFVPGRLAHALVSPYRDAEILDFPMTEDPAQIRLCMERNAEKIAPVASSGSAVLALIGDPNFFSTFTRLCQVMEEKYPSIVCRTEPGISAITAFAAVAGVSLSGGFCVSDGTEQRYRVLLKVRRPREAASALGREGFRRFVLVEKMYLPDMHVYRDGDLPETCDYLSVLYAER